jgi:hypothetical protein
MGTLSYLLSRQAEEAALLAEEQITREAPVTNEVLVFGGGLTCIRDCYQ